MRSPTNPELWTRIDAYEFDKPGTSLPFSARLARDNGWPSSFALRVIEEYKRFLYLLCVSDETLTPSEQVDQAWHLHMVYTRDYWDRMCRDTLHRPVHHQPTEGGLEEGARFRDSYSRTLVLLAQEFQAKPPADIWPDENARFAAPEPLGRIDRSRFLVFPKPEFLFTVWAAILWGSGALLAASGMLGAGETLVILMFATAVSAAFLLPSGRRKQGGGGCGGTSDSGCGGGCGGD